MLHLFGRNGNQEGAPGERLNGSVIVSHILVKFLKRLRHMERPRLLDLGRVSGSNIEFFARAGCKVQVEDLLLACDAGSPEEISRDDSPPDAPKPQGAAPRVISDAPRSATMASAMSSPTPGARPTRRIVVPPRRFPSTQPGAHRAGVQGTRVTGPAAAPRTRNSLLPTRLAFPDETFDAIVAWDIFNYYEPQAMNLLSAETRRVLKPGGLLLGYFQARRPDGAETPGRYRILDESRVSCDGQSAPVLTRHVYQNRDIEKMFLGLSIVELYFLKNSTRELLMEKKAKESPVSRTPSRPPVLPKPRFSIE